MLSNLRLSTDEQHPAPIGHDTPPDWSAVFGLETFTLTKHGGKPTSKAIPADRVDRTLEELAGRFPRPAVEGLRRLFDACRQKPGHTVHAWTQRRAA